MKFSHFFLLFVIILCACVFPSVAATEVVLQDGVLVAQGVDDEYGVGAFNIILVHGSDVSFELDEWVAPYTGAINPDWEEGTKIAGFTGSIDLPTGDVSLCRLNITGNGSVVIYVNEFYNSNGFPIAMVNPAYGEGDSEASPEPVYPEPTTGGTTEIVDDTPAPRETLKEPIVTAATEDDITTANGDENTPETEAMQTGVVTAPTDSVGTVQTPDIPVNPTKSPLNPVMVIISVCLMGFIVQRVYKE